MPKKYGHKAQSTKGSKHPDSIMPGLETVDKLGGSQGSDMKMGKGSDGHKKSVKRGDGTSNMEARGSKKRGDGIKVPYSGSKNYPGELRQHSGLKAPKSGKQPK